MQAYARTIRCRHRTLVEHFGQELETNAETGCGACDVCLGEVVALPGSTLIARKISPRSGPRGAVVWHRACRQGAARRDGRKRPAAGAP